MHITGAETSSHLPTHRARRAPRGPNIGLLGCTSLSRTYQPATTGSTRRPQTQRPPPAVEVRRAGRGVCARDTHRSTTALGPRPGFLTLRPVVATPEPRTKRGLCSSRLEESGPLAAGQAGARSEGLRVELHLLVSALLPDRGRFAVGTYPVSNFPSLRPSSGCSGVPASALTPVAAHACALAPAAAHACALAPGLVGAGRGVCQPQDSLLEYPYFTFP